jgi:DNA-binding transcriptional LysR family regulator
VSCTRSPVTSVTTPGPRNSPTWPCCAGLPPPSPTSPKEAGLCGSGTRETLRSAIGPHLAVPAVELHSNAAVKVLVTSADYPAVLSELALASELRDGRLVEIPVRDLDLRRTLRAVWRRGTTLRGAASEFLALTTRMAAVPARPPSRATRQ